MKSLNTEELVVCDSLSTEISGLPSPIFCQQSGIFYFTELPLSSYSLPLPLLLAGVPGDLGRRKTF